MMRSCWRKQLAALATAVVLVGGAVQAQATGDGPAVIVLREAGQPERRCKIEQSTPQPDGSIIHVVRDLATGEQFRVKDTRKRKTELAQVVARIRGTESSSLTIMPMPPATNNSSAQRVPTTAELAGARFATELASGRPAALLDSVSQQIHDLHAALGPSQREMAAEALTASGAHAAPEVIGALIAAAQHDPAPSVRLCVVRCLYRLSGEVPDVVPVLAQMQEDANPQVQLAAKQSMAELSKHAK